jgi:hypothetical protein
MDRIKTMQTPVPSLSLSRNLMLAATCLLLGGFLPAQSAASAQSPGHPPKSHRSAKKVLAAQEVAPTPAPPPMPKWPVNDTPNPPSVVWDASGLRINASNSSLQQILTEVSTNTGTRIVGNVPDQRVFGSYGPGQASDVLLQLLQGSGFNVLLAGDLGHGAPSQIVLTPRRGGASNSQAGPNPQQQQIQQPDQDENDSVDQPEQPEQPEETVPAIPAPTQQPEGQPGVPPNGQMRTPQEIMQEMQQRQLLQQQQMQQQMQQQQQQGNPTAPQQQQENPQ